LVSTRAWKDSPSVRKALSRHFRKYGANAINEKNFNGIDLEPNQKTLMKSFWDKNAWAREKFSKSMKEAYCLIYSEDKKTHTIKMYPDEMVQETIRLSKADGVEYGPEDFQTIYKRRSSEEVIQLDPKGFGAIEKYVFDDEKKSNVMSDTWGQTIADLGKYLREKIRDDKTEKGEKILYGSILNYSTKQVIESLKQKRYNEEGQEVEPYATASELYRIYAMTYALCIDLKLRDCTEFMKEKLEENYSKFKDNPTYKEVVKES
jgi:hypothetical protein